MGLSSFLKERKNKKDANHLINDLEHRSELFYPMQGPEEQMTLLSIPPQYQMHIMGAFAKKEAFIYSNMTQRLTEEGSRDREGLMQISSNPSHIYVPDNKEIEIAVNVHLPTYWAMVRKKKSDIKLMYRMKTVALEGTKEEKEKMIEERINMRIGDMRLLSHIDFFLDGKLWGIFNKLSENSWQREGIRELNSDYLNDAFEGDTMGYRQFFDLMVNERLTPDLSYRGI